MASNSEIETKGAAPGWRRPRLMMQTAAAVLLSAFFYLGIVVLRRPFPAGFAYPEQSVGRWALFVCLLLTFWALTGLFQDWRNAMRRQRSIAGTSIPPSASLESEGGTQEVVDAVQVAAMRYGDGLLARRVETAIARFRSSHSAAAAAEELSMAGDASLADLEASHAPVRLLLYAIPILGFAGTVMAIRQTLEKAALPPQAPQQLDAIRAALTGIISRLAGSFDTALLALVLTLIVMVAFSWVMEKEKSLLLAIENFCYVHLLPLMEPVTGHARDENSEATLMGVLTDLRATLDFMAQNAAAQSLQPGEAERQWTAALEGLRSDLGNAWSQHFELVKQYLEQKQAASPAVDLPSGARELRGRAGKGRSLDVASASTAQVEDLVGTLEGLSDSIREMNAFLQRLAQRLRSQTDEPVVVKVTLKPGTSSSTPIN